MSAYIVGQDLIRYLVSAGPALTGCGEFRWYRHCHAHELRAGDDERAAVVGQMLWSENVRSVSTRYPDSVATNDLPGPVDDGPSYIYQHRAWRDPEFDPVQVLKACDCLEYQSCEHDGWPDSEACAFLDALRDLCIPCLPGYEEAEWGAPRERKHLVLLSSLAKPEHLQAPTNVPVQQESGRVAPPIHTPTARPTLEEAQALVGGLVQLLELDNGEQLLVNEEGRLQGLEVNEVASRRWPNWGPLVGPVVHLQGAARWVV